MPAMVASANGVSCTRSLPKRSCSPAVARNTPPLMPTSCPITTTSASCCISQPCAIAMASTMVMSANSMSAGFRGVLSCDGTLLVQARRQDGEQMIEHGIGGRLRLLQVFAHRCVDLTRALFQERVLLGNVPQPGIAQKRANPDQGFESPRILHFLT